MSRRGAIDWESVVVFVLAIAAVVGIAWGVIWAAGQPTCYGIEPDGDVEQLWPCPAPHTDGERFPIGEDEFEERELD